MIILRIPNNGLGNQMFAYAYGRFLSIQKKDEIILDYSDTGNRPHDHGDSFEKTLSRFHLNYSIKIDSKKELVRIGKSKALLYLVLRKYASKKKEGDKWLWKYERENVSKLIEKGIFLNDDAAFFCDEYLIRGMVETILVQGLWQNIEYLDMIKGILLEEFTFEDILQNTRLSQIADDIQENDICVHCRRGDYVSSTTLYLCERSYFDKAIIIYDDMLNRNIGRIFVFSDDIEWAKENILTKHDVVFINGNTSIEDMALMTYFKNYVISNSTFSFWGQYLSKHKDRRTIAPSRWFRDERSIEIYQSDWITI